MRIRILSTVLLCVALGVAYADLSGSPISGGGGTTNASDLSSGTIPAARIGDNTVTNAKMLDGTLDLAGSPSKFTGTLPKANGGFGASIASATGIPSWATGTITWNSLAALMLQYGVTYNPADNTWIFPASITATEYVSSASDNTRGVTVPNTADPTTTNLAAGKMWVTDNSVKVRSNDNTVTFIAGSLIKTFSFAIDNVTSAAADNVLLTRVPIARTILRWDCSASVDNVVGNFMECATDNVISCGVVDAATVGGTTRTDAPTTDSTITDAAIAAGAWMRWSTTSVGTAVTNRLSCTIQYRE